MMESTDTAQLSGSPCLYVLPSEDEQATVSSAFIQDIHVNQSDEMSVAFQKCHKEAPQSRMRRKKRPFSPELVVNTLRKSPVKTKVKKRGFQDSKMKLESQLKPFSCDKCGSSYVVNPSCSRLPLSQLKKIPSKRQKFDPVTNKVLNLCNACGLALSRPQKKFKEVQVKVSLEDKDRYLAEAVAFAKAVALRASKPAAERLYCPSFKNRPCGCIQTYISHQGENEEDSLEDRVENLLHFLNTARDLGHQKNHCLQNDSLKPKGKNLNTEEKKQRQIDFEQFVLETRQILRERFRLCERACQRILLYSNNFLHKRLKSTPNQSSRLSRQQGRYSVDQLKSIEELGSIPCCSDSCSRLALTHSALLQEWRMKASQGQRQARRVLAEMLTPSGGTKANCYKFISMVTGCGPSTISSVSHQMRVTKGNREPPEHGLKKWYRENPRKRTKVASTQPSSDLLQAESGCASSSILNVHAEESKSCTSGQEHDPKFQLEQQRLELEEAKRLLLLKQQELDHCHQIIGQHLQQQSFLNENSFGSNPIWKVDTVKSSSKEVVDSNTPMINFPLEPGIAGVPGLSSGQSVQLLDLVPGTYIVVPADFNDPSLESQKIISPLTSNDLHGQEEIVYADNLSLDSALVPSKGNGVIIDSENCAQTIFNFSVESGDVSTILQGVEPQVPSGTNNASEIFVPVSPDCNAVSSAGVISPCTTEMTDSEFQPVPKSHPTPVITQSSHLCSAKPIQECHSSTLTSVEYLSTFKCPKPIECIGDFDILSSTQQSQITASLNAFEKLFE